MLADRFHCEFRPPAARGPVSAVHNVLAKCLYKRRLPRHLTKFRIGDGKKGNNEAKESTVGGVYAFRRNGGREILDNTYRVACAHICLHAVA